MEFDHVISSRKTIRKYQNFPVDSEQLTQIIESGMLAPSAKNRQPWRFYILTDKQKEDIVQMMYQWEKINTTFPTSIRGSAAQMQEANKAIIIYSPIYHSKNKKSHYKKPDYLSLGAAIENMTLKCADIGLGSAWLCDTLYIENEINAYLNLQDLEQISTLIIGYPKEIPERRKRLPIENLILH